MIPTRVLAPPYHATGRNGKRTMFLSTDAGEMEIQDAADATGFRKTQLRWRVTATPDSWKEPDIFDLTRPRQDRSGGERVLYRGLVIPHGKPKKAIDQLRQLGTWERKVWAPDKFRREQIVNDLPQRDQEYNTALRHHRSVCR